MKLKLPWAHSAIEVKKFGLELDGSKNGYGTR